MGDFRGSLGLRGEFRGPAVSSKSVFRKMSGDGTALEPQDHCATSNEESV